MPDDQCIVEYSLTAWQIWSVAMIAGVSGASLVVITIWLTEIIRAWWRETHR